MILFQNTIESYSFIPEDFSNLNFQNSNSIQLKNNTNKINIEFNYGFNNLSIPEIISDKLDKTNNINIKYGFYRELKINKVKEFFKFSNEFINFNVNSSHLNISNKIKNEFTQESWSLSFGINNGNGIDINSNFKENLFHNILLSHSSTFDFNRIDIEQNSLFEDEQKIIKRFDEKLTLGQTFESGIYLTLNENIKLKVAYQDKIINDNTNVFNMLLPSSIDFIILNIPTYYEYELIKELGINYPYLLFAFRTTYSYLVYSLRNNNGNFPLNSNNTLRYNGFSIGLSFYFDN